MVQMLWFIVVMTGRVREEKRRGLQSADKLADDHSGVCGRCGEDLQKEILLQDQHLRNSLTLYTLDMNICLFRPNF